MHLFIKLPFFKSMTLSYALDSVSPSVRYIMAQLHVSNWCPCSDQWCQAATPVIPEGLITLYDKKH